METISPPAPRTILTVTPRGFDSHVAPDDRGTLARERHRSCVAHAAACPVMTQLFPQTPVAVRRRAHG